MDGGKLQGKVFKAYGKAAGALGFDFDVYRSASMLDPLAAGNKLATIKASLTTGFEYGAYNKPGNPLWTLLADATTLQAGDWLVKSSDPAEVFYLADKQDLLPLPAVGCEIKVSITRPGFDSTSGAMEASETTIATNLPTIAINRKVAGKPASWFPSHTDSVVTLPEWEFYINARAEGALREHDVIQDSIGRRFTVQMAHLTSFGYLAFCKLSQP